MANNKSILILRGSTTFDPDTSDLVLLDGQPFYSKKDGKLRIGKQDKKIRELDDVAALNLSRENGSVSQKDLIWNNDSLWDGADWSLIKGLKVPGANASGFQSAAFGGTRYDYINYGPDGTDGDSAADGSTVNSSANAYGRTPTSAEGNQSFAAGGSSHAYGEWAVAIGKDVKAYQRASAAIGGGCVAGMTEDEFNARFWDQANGVPINGGQGKDESGKIKDDHGSIYKKSYSFAIALGESNIVKERGSVAFGTSNNVTGEGDIAIGVGNRSNFNETFNIGMHNEGNGLDTFNFGAYNKNSGYRSVAVGTENNISGGSSIAAGKNNVITSNLGFALGVNNTVSSVRSIALGEGNTMSGDNTTALGSNNIVKWYGGAIGHQNIVEGANNFAIGTNNKLSGTYNTALGFQNKVEVNGDIKTSTSFAAGVNNEIYGDSSVALGNDNTITGNRSLAGGYGNIVNSDYSFTYGFNLKSEHPHQVVFGEHNENKSNTLLEIGNGTGTSDNARKNAFEVLTNGGFNSYGSAAIFGNLTGLTTEVLNDTTIKYKPLFLDTNGTVRESSAMVFSSIYTGGGVTLKGRAFYDNEIIVSVSDDSNEIINSKSLHYYINLSLDSSSGILTINGNNIAIL